MDNSDYGQIVAIVNRTRTRWKVCLILEGLLYTWAVLLIWLLAGIALDNLFHLSVYLRAFFLVGLLGLAAFLLYRRVMSSLFVRITTDQAALYIESRLKNMDNKIINSLQLGRSDSANRRIVELILHDTVASVQQAGIERAVDKRRVRNCLIVFSVAAVALVLYSVVLPAHFRNALARLTTFTNAPPPITRISLTVEPGDARVFTGDDLLVTAAPTNDELPEEVVFEYKIDGTIRSERMSFDGKTFNYTIANIESRTRYRVIADDFKSEWYSVTVTTPLRIEKIDIVFTFPEYLRIAGPFTHLDTPEELRVLKGTHAEFRVSANREIGRGEMRLDSSARPFKSIEHGLAVVEMDIHRDLTYVMYLEDSEGSPVRDLLSRRIYCYLDEKPVAEFLEPTADFKGSVEKKLTTIIKARDDVALASLKLFVGKEDDDADDTVLKEWKFNEGINEGFGSLKTMAIESFAISLSEHFKAGDEGYIYARVLDMKGGGTQTGRISIRVISVEEEKRAREAEKKTIYDKLREIYDIQVYSRKTTERLRRGDKNALSLVKDKQLDVYNKSVALIEYIGTLSENRFANIRDGLRELSTGRMVDVVRLIDDLDRSFSRKSRGDIVAVQKEVERELLRLLGEIKSEKEEEAGEKRDEAGERENKEPANVLKEMQIILKDFIAEQRRVIATSEELAAKKPEDFTREDEDMKRKLQIVEDQWAKFLDEKSTELDKIPEQVFSKSTLIKELRQIYEEIDLAADELTKPGIHLPVTEEQIGLELAEKLDAKLESWLPEESDKIKWDLEEPSQDYEAPMAELPEELEDLIGDLIREEEELDPEMEDISSSWMDSLDDGAGWATMDGPISNMSAKGKTGNTLPNSSEISGRSGEGRQGKSNGEFVTDTAVGKGGRRTPTRIMDDPYEPGVVKDEMTQETGGATGGGKLSGEGGEGLRGHVPPELQLLISRAREKYSDIINRGERIAHRLNKRGFSSEKLEETIELMRRLDYQMKEFKYTDVVGVHRQIIEGLETSRNVLRHDAKVRREEDSRLPGKVRRLLNDTMTTEFPEDYEELLKGYYKSISR